MKIIKEGVTNVPELLNKARVTVDVVTGDAKKHSDEAKKNFEDVTEINKFDRKKPFTSGEHQPKPEEAEKELQKINLDESLFESVELTEMPNVRLRGIEVIERGVDIFNAAPLAKFDARMSKTKSPQQLALEFILDNPSPIADIYWVSYNADGSKAAVNIFAKRILSTSDLLHDAELSRSHRNMRDVVIDGVGDRDFWENGRNTSNIEAALNAGKVVMQYAEEPINKNWRGFSYPRYGQGIVGTLRFGRDIDKNESLKLTEDKFDQSKIDSVADKWNDLDRYNFAYALDSEEDRHEAIDECNRILNILNNITIEDIEISQYIENEDFDDDLSTYYSDEPEFDEDFSQGSKLTDAEKDYYDGINNPKFIPGEGEPFADEKAKAHQAFEDSIADESLFDEDFQHGTKLTDAEKDYYNGINNPKFIPGEGEPFASEKEKAHKEFNNSIKDEMLNEGKEITAYHDLVKAAPKVLFVKPFKAKEILEGNYNIINDYIKSGLDAETYFQKQVDYYGTKYIDWFADGCPTKFVKNYNESIESNPDKSFGMINYTAYAMNEQGLSSEIKDMRTKALSENYVVVCNKYLDECNKLANEYDDEYEITGIPFVTQGLDINNIKFTKQDLEDMYLGKLIRTGTMINPISNVDNSLYNGVEGTVTDVDDMGQLHGSWGGLTLIPGVDEFQVI